MASPSLAGRNATGTTAVRALVPDSGPGDDATEDLATEARHRGARIGAATGTNVGVTGFTALAIDISERLTDVLPLYVGTVPGLSLIVLLLVLRSVMVPTDVEGGMPAQKIPLPDPPADRPRATAVRQAS